MDDNIAIWKIQNRVEERMLTTVELYDRIAEQMARLQVGKK